MTAAEALRDLAAWCREQSAERDRFAVLTPRGDVERAVMIGIATGYACAAQEAERRAQVAAECDRRAAELEAASG